MLKRIDKQVFQTLSSLQTIKLGSYVGKRLRFNLVIMLSGVLGSGKTTFVKGLLSGFGVSKTKYVTSPTYSIINEYSGWTQIYHIDLYRLVYGFDLDEIGLRDIFSSDGVVILEWPDRFDYNKLLFSKRLDINFHVLDGFKRSISFVFYGFSFFNMQM